MVRLGLVLAIAALAPIASCVPVYREGGLIDTLKPEARRHWRAVWTLKPYHKIDWPALAIGNGGSLLLIGGLLTWVARRERRRRAEDGA